MSQQAPGYSVQSVEVVAEGRDMQARLFTLAAGEVIPWHFHTEVTDWYFVLEGRLSIETRAPRADVTVPVGDSYKIAPKTAHLISNTTDNPCRFLLLQGVGKYDFVKVG